jgi:hypothetical protein
MRHVVMHKAGPDDEAGVPPPPKLVQEIDVRPVAEPNANDTSRGAR